MVEQRAGRAVGRDHRRQVALVAALAAALVALVAATLAVPPAEASRRPAHAGERQVGDVLLTRCDVVRGALCGSIERPWEPGDPTAGNVTVGFAFVPARDTSRPAVGTLVAHEGGPGYSTTGSGGSYVAMYGALLDRRNLLLVDQRGTGLSEPVRCPELQNLRMAYAVAAGRCGRSLGPRADDYTTALSADDLAEVVRRLEVGTVDVYGDSYGTFFAQVFAGRHPALVRSVVLDGAYPTYGESAWYPTQGPAMRRAFTRVCRRSAACREAGAPFLATLRKVLDQVRTEPLHGRSHDADGRRARVVVDGRALVSVAFGATYTPTFYRELTAALRSALRGDRVPLLRLVAEATGGGTYAGPPAAFSEGLYAAVACHDYPQLYPMTSPPGAREQAYLTQLAHRSFRRPGTYAPFRVLEYAGSDWQTLDSCMRWPVAPAANPAGPPRPPGGTYSDVPVLVLSGELDSITTAAEGDLVAAQLPNAEHVVVRNSFHVTAIGDTDHCAVRLVRAFVRAPEGAEDPELRACAREVEPVRALGTFPRSVDEVTPARSARPAPALVRRAAAAAALTVADLPDRWWNNYSGTGVGLRGGTWSYLGGRTVQFRLEGVRLVGDLAVSGRATWERYAERMDVDLRLSGAVSGRLTGHWDTRARGADATLVGVLDGTRVRLTVPAP